MIKENDDNSWLWKPCEVDLFYTHIESEEEIGKERVYEIMMFDYLNPINKIVNYNKYIAWKCKLIKGFDGYNLKQIYIFSFPIISFKAAISRMNFIGQINEDNIKPYLQYDLKLKFRRVSKKRLIILSKELVECPNLK